MIIKVLGKGCTKCELLEDHVKKALEATNTDASVEKVTDTEGIEAYHVLQTPALVIDDKVVSQGRVLSAKKIAKLIQ